MRPEFMTGRPAQLDAWVQHYNHDRPHQAIGMMAPWARFGQPTPTRLWSPHRRRWAPRLTWADRSTCPHRGVLIATHARRHHPDK